MMILSRGSAMRKCLLFFLILVPARSADPTVKNLGNEENREKSALKFSSDENALLELIGSLVGMNLGEITAIISLAKVGLGVVDALESIFTKVFNGTSMDFNFFQRPGLDRQLLSIFEIVTLRLEQIQNGIRGTESGLRSLAQNIPTMIRWEIALDTLESYVQPINNLYHKFSVYQKHKMSVENMTLMDFAQTVVSHDISSIQSLMAKIHSIVSPSDPPNTIGSRSYRRNEYEVNHRVGNEMTRNLRHFLVARNIHLSKKMARVRMQQLSMRPSIFNMLEEAIDSYSICNEKQSPQQLIFGLYTMIALAQAKGYTMSIFGYDLLKYYNKGSFKIERQLSKDLYIHYSSALFTLGLHALKQASTAYRRCDPVKHVENETYIQITELLQGYIENEVDLNSQGTCGYDCGTYKHSEVKGCYLPDDQYCGKHRRCKGVVHSCKFFDSDAEVCLGSKPYRRYDWVKYEDGVVLGHKHGQCENRLTVDSWWRFLYHCSYCVCLCDDPKSPTSDRFISLRPAVSDIAENRVVTGLRFVKKNRVLQLEVMEGLSISQGQISGNSLKWVDSEPISVESDKFKDGEDYVTLKYEAREIDLDRLSAPKGHVVTGVRFRMLGQHVNLKMWVTPINFTSGLLNPEMSFWVSNDNTPETVTNPRYEVYLHRPDDPSQVVSESSEISLPGTYVQFQPTDMNVDMSQLTVPFFDAQPVAPSPATWLEGVEIYHRGSPGSGGFIGLQTFNFNLSRQLHYEQEEHKILLEQETGEKLTISV